MRTNLGTLAAALVALSFLVSVANAAAPVAAARDDAGYSAWLPQFRQALLDYERGESSEEEEQVRAELRGKPSGGASSYPVWLAMYGYFLDRLDRSLVAGKILEYAALGRPAQLTEQYGPWLDALTPRLDAYNRWVRPEQLTAIQRMVAVVPPSSEAFYPRWLTLHNEYMELWRRWGRPETKTVLDYLARVKPSAATQAPEFLREPERTAEQVAADSLFVDRYLDLTVLIKQKLQYQAANGNARAREQLERLRQIAR